VSQLQTQYSIMLLSYDYRITCVLPICSECAVDRYILYTQRGYVIITTNCCWCSYR